MHEGDADVEAYKKWLADCFNIDEAFTLEVGESCRIRNEHVDKLPHGERFKLMYKRTDVDAYHWLDCEGNQGTHCGLSEPLQFYVKHWEKI